MNKLKISNKLLKKVKNGLITKDQAMFRRFLRLTKKRGRFDPLAHKLEIVKKIKNFAENGEVLLIESGRDCDGGEYGGRTCLMDANFVSVNAYIEKAEIGRTGQFILNLIALLMLKIIADQVVI
jgi:tetrahydrodipicolinate N-succinyltransferase